MNLSVKIQRKKMIIFSCVLILCPLVTKESQNIICQKYIVYPYVHITYRPTGHQPAFLVWSVSIILPKAAHRRHMAVTNRQESILIDISMF